MNIKIILVITIIVPTMYTLTGIGEKIATVTGTTGLRHEARKFATNLLELPATALASCPEPETEPSGGNNTPNQLTPFPPDETDGPISLPPKDDSTASVLSGKDDLASVLSRKDDLASVLSEEDDLASVLSGEDDLASVLSEEDDLASVLSGEDDLASVLSEEDDLASVLSEEDDTPAKKEPKGPGHNICKQAEEEARIICLLQHLEHN